MEEAWELAVVSDELIDNLPEDSRKTGILLDERFLGGRPPKLHNMRIDLKRDQSDLSAEQVNHLIEAIARSETSTLGYSAAGFVPVLFLLNSMEYIQSLNDSLVDKLAIVAVFLLGFSGMYYAIYKAMYLGPKRIFLEVYLSGLVFRYRTHLFPGGWFQIPNWAAMLSIPVGYALILTILIRVLLT